MVPSEHLTTILPVLPGSTTTRVTPLQQQLIRLHGKGLSYNAIAAQVGKPTGTVSVILARLVKRGLLPKRTRCG